MVNVKFVLFLKDNIAVAKSRVSDIKNVDMSVYDSFEEVTEDVFDTIKLPSEKKNGVWVETSKFPSMEYPQIEPEEKTPTAQDDIDAMLIDHEYRLTMIELGVSE